MIPPVSGLGPVFQLGVVVRDIEAAMQHWIKAMGVGPFIYMHDPGPIHYTYRGQRTDPQISIAFTYSDNLQIELIQQRNDAPSPYVDFLASGREGLQHLAFYVDDMSAACAQLEANGLQRVYTIAPEGGDERIYYYEDPRQPGTMTELIMRTPLRRRVHAAILAATKGWEGAEPVRRFDSIRHYAQASGLI
jgi:catechol 2,3-dioxygenase-like lactoylglutathione lyase family enzyme